jgi:hypothetical protein
MLGTQLACFPGTSGACDFRIPLASQGFGGPVRALVSMASRQTNKHDRETDLEIERYRQAALDALGQLEWCVDYLYGLRKADIARAISRNRHQIIERAGL